MSRPLLGIYGDAAAVAAQDQASTNFASVSDLQTEVLRLDQLLLTKETTISGTNPVSLSEVSPLPAAASALVALSDEVTLRASTTYVNEQIATRALGTDLTALTSRVASAEADLPTRATATDLTALTTRVSTAEGALTNKTDTSTTAAIDTRLQAAEADLPTRATATDVAAIDQRLVTAEASVALAASAVDLANTQVVVATNLATVLTKASINSVLDVGILVEGNTSALTAAQAAATALTTRVTAAESSLAGAQDSLTGIGDVPGLVDALAGKNDLITHPGSIPGMTTALTGKQDVLTGTADVPSLDAALAGKQATLTHPGDVPQLAAALQLRHPVITTTSMLSPTLVTDLLPALTYIGQIVNDTDTRNLTERAAALATDKLDSSTAASTYQTLGSAAGHATAVTASFTQVTADFLAVNQELSARAYSSDVHTRTEVNALLADKQDTTTADATYETLAQASTSLASVNASLTNLQTADTNTLTVLAGKQDAISSGTVQVGDFELLTGTTLRNIAGANNGGISVSTTADRISLSAETALATKVNVADAGTVYINPTGLNTVVGLMNTRFTTVEGDIATRASQHASLQGEVTNGQGAQNTRLDDLELQDSIHTTSDSTMMSLILNLDSRLDALDGGALGGLRIATGSIGPISVGNNAANYTSTSTPHGPIHASSHVIVFPSGKFSSSPRVWLMQASPANNAGHGTIIRMYVLSVTVSGCTIIVSESQGSNGVTIDYLAIQD